MNPEEQTPNEQQPNQPPTNPPAQDVEQNFSQAPPVNPQQQPPQPEAPPALNSPTDVLGILSLVFIFFAAPIGLILGIIGLVKAKKNHYSNTLSLIGTIINGIISLLVIPIYLILVFATFSGVQQKGQDSEREVDIKALHSQAEAFYAQTGTYPTLAQINDASWRAVNMKGLDNEALRDPAAEAGNYIIVASPSKGSYSYQVYKADGVTVCTLASECQKNILTATLSEKTSGQNGLFIKKSLN